MLCCQRVCYLSKSYEDFCFRDGVAVAKLMADGNLMYQGQVVDMHSCAAQARGIKASRVNGFDYWYVIRENKPVSIADVREQYRKAKQ